jgi:hypothetical protein
LSNFTDRASIDIQKVIHSSEEDDLTPKKDLMIERLK